MNERIKCPKCNQETFENPRYYSVRGEMVLFDGKCVNCGYDITAEELYNDLKGKYDFERDFDIVERPLENILEKCEDRDLNLKYLILAFFLKVYDHKLKWAREEKDIKWYFLKRNKFQQILEKRQWSEKEKFKELARLMEEKYNLFSAERPTARYDRFETGAMAEIGTTDVERYYEYIISLDPSDPESYLDLARIKEGEESWPWQGPIDEAIKNYQSWFELSLTNYDSSSLPFLENEYKKILARLYIKRGERREGKDEDFMKALDFIEKIDLNIKGSFHTLNIQKGVFLNEKIDYQEVQTRQAPFPVQVKGLELRAWFNLRDIEKALSVYDEIEKICPNFMDHYHQPNKEKKEIDGRTITRYFDFYDFDDSYLFACLTQLYFKTGKPHKLFEIYDRLYWNVLTEDLKENGPPYGCIIGDVLDYVLIPYLLGRSRFVYLQSLERSDETRELTEVCLEHFETVLLFYLGGLLLSWAPIPAIYRPLQRLLPSPGTCFTQCHCYRGELFERLDDFDNAFLEYKNAQKYSPEDQKIKDKIKRLRTKFTDDFRIEVENLTKIETKEIPLDTTKRIISLLDSIKNSFPEPYEETKELLEKLGDTRPYILLNSLRRTAEEYFNKIYKGPPDKEFNEKVSELCDRNEINPYIKNLLVFVWSTGSKGSHPLKQYVKELKKEDIEVVISAVVRFLSWYMENCSKKK